MKTLKKPKSQSAKSLKPLKKSPELSTPASCPPENTTVSVSNDGTDQFEKAIAESQSKIAEAEGPKRGRGRPRKAISEHESGIDNPDPNIRGGDNPQSIQPAACYPPGTTATLWKIGSKFAARRTGFAGFECDTAEVEALDGATVPVLNRYLPPELVEASPLATMTLTVLAVFGMKYLEYSDWRSDQAKKAEQPGDPAPIQ